MGHPLPEEALDPLRLLGRQAFLTRPAGRFDVLVAGLPNNVIAAVAETGHRTAISEGRFDGAGCAPVATFFLAALLLALPGQGRGEVFAETVGALQAILLRPLIRLSIMIIMITFPN